MPEEGRKLTSVDNVHERNRKNIRLLGAGKIRDVSVERDALKTRA